MNELVPVRRALISVADKTDLVPFARSLVAHGVEIVSTGGTGAALAQAGIAVRSVESLTGLPELLGGRVKTLHPAIHAGLLALRDDDSHVRALAAQGFDWIDLVCINLYPFEATISRPGVASREAIEQIDIGGPAMIRSAAKNHTWVVVVTSPGQYDRVVGELDANGGCTTAALRADLAAAAFSRTSEYDAAIAAFLSRRSPAPFGPVLRLNYVLVNRLRYGENPHQTAALYRDPASTGATIVNARLLHGKPMSYNNVVDAAAALELVKALRRLEPDRAGACVIKHANPCGAGSAAGVVDALGAALDGDPVASYGGILAVNRAMDEPAARRLAEAPFLEVVVAPEFDPAAVSVLAQRWPNVRVLATGEKQGSAARKLDYRSIPGGMLVQDRDTRTPSPEQWRHAAGPAPTAEQLAQAAMLATVCRYVASNAVVIGGGTSTGAVGVFGVGSAQVDRVGACRNAVDRAGARAAGAIAVSDGFFPFPDGPEVLIRAGVKVVVHPGGSKRDEATFALCEQHGVTCLTTGVRQFRH